MPILEQFFGDAPTAQRPKRHANRRQDTPYHLFMERGWSVNPLHSILNDDKQIHLRAGDRRVARADTWLPALIGTPDWRSDEWTENTPVSDDWTELPT
jgi:hypothetical protein